MRTGGLIAVARAIRVRLRDRTRFAAWTRRRRFAAFALALAGLFVGLRLIHLRADPPIVYPNARSAHELFVEPPAKAHEARNFALTGSFRTNPADNYQFWRAQSPVWVYPLAAYFRVVGVSYVKLRLFAIATALVGFCALVQLLRDRVPMPVIGACAAAIAASAYDIPCSRAGLLEPLVSSLLVVCVICLRKALEVDSRHLLAAHAAFALALLTKQTAFFFAPVVFVVTLITLVRALRRPRPIVFVGLPAGFAVALALFLLVYVTRDAYWQKLTWNYGHMLYQKRVQSLTFEADILTKVLARLGDRERWTTGFFWIFPVLGPLGALGLGRVVYRAVRRRASALEGMAASWLVFAFGSLLLTDRDQMRYQLVLFAPLMLLAATFLGALTSIGWARRKAWVRCAMMLPVVAAIAATDGRWFVKWARAPRREISSANTTVNRILGRRRAVVIGLWAAPIVFDTRHLFYYVKERFNADEKTLSTLGVTHLLLKNGPDYTRSILQRAFPGLIQRAVLLKTLRIRGESVRLLAVPPGGLERSERPGK